MAEFFPVQRSEDMTINGQVTRDVLGRPVVLLVSDQAISKKTISFHQRTNALVVRVGDTFEGGVVSGIHKVRVVFQAGDKLEEFWRIDIEVEG